MELQQEIKRYEDAHKRLVAAVRSCYPIGARVSVRLGRSTVIGTVVQHGPDWSFEGSTEVFVKNERTGKVRRFNGRIPDFYNAVVVSA